MQGIHSLVILILLLHNVELAEISSEQAMQMATKMRGCIDLKPGDHLPADYLEKMLGQWWVVKMFDAPMREDHPIPPITIAKNPVTGQYYGEGQAPPMGDIHVPLIMGKHGRMDMNHNMSVPIMGTPMDLVLTVKGTLLEMEPTGKCMLWQGCGKLLGPEYQITSLMCKENKVDPTYLAMIEKMLKALGYDLTNN